MIFNDPKSSFMKSFNILQKGLDTAMLRHKVIANNVANINTPNFKRSAVSFESELRKALEGHGSIKARRIHPDHLKFKEEVGVDFGKVTPKTIRENDTIYRNDGNNVDINAEIANLAKNTILYESTFTLVNKRISSLKQLIASGAR